MSWHSAEKIGGTSMAAAATLFGNVLVAGREGADLYNRIFVVSAYAGMTDLLLWHKKSGKPGIYDAAVRALHRTLVEGDATSREQQRAA